VPARHKSLHETKKGRATNDRRSPEVYRFAAGLSRRLAISRLRVLAAGPVDVQHRGSNSFEFRVQTQCAAKALQGVVRLAHVQITLSHAGGGAEVVRVDFQRSAAVGDAFRVTAEAVLRDGSLVPRFGEPRSEVDEFGGADVGPFVTTFDVVADDLLEKLLLLRSSGPTPDGPNGVLGQGADASIAIAQSLAERRIDIVVAQVAER
jgi:hypothetical protein